MKKAELKEAPAGTPATEPKKTWGDSIAQFCAEWASTILILLFGITALLQAYVVPTSSMETTIMTGDHLFADKLTYSPPGPVTRHILPYRDVKRGDIIVFRFPLHIQENYVKRVIGVPGDRIKLVEKTVWLNGQPLTESYKRHESSYIDPYRDNFPGAPENWVYPHALSMLRNNVQNGEVIVPPGHYFAMGDNRDVSLDSRYWGFVPRENIIGKPLFVWWSYDAPTQAWTGFSLDHYKDLALNFFTKTRWSRMFRPLRGTDIP